MRPSPTTSTLSQSRLSTQMLKFSRPLRMLLAITFVAVAASAAQTAMAQPMGPHGDMMGGRHGGMGEGRHMDHMLSSVNATPEQRAQVKQIMDAAHTDLKAMHANGATLRQQSQALLAQPTIDARAVETLRQQMSAQHDAVSKRMTQALVDAANVLTPTQRKALADRMAQRRALMEKHRAERAALDGASK